MNKRSVTVERMARDLDVTTATMFKWRLGEGLKPKNLKRICDYLECTPNDIFLN